MCGHLSHRPLFQLPPVSVRCDQSISAGLLFEHSGQPFAQCVAQDIGWYFGSFARGQKLSQQQFDGVSVVYINMRFISCYDCARDLFERSLAHKCAETLARDNQSFSIETAVGARRGVKVDSELSRKFAHGGEGRARL